MSKREVVIYCPYCKRPAAGGLHPRCLERYIERRGRKSWIKPRAVQA